MDDRYRTAIDALRAAGRGALSESSLRQTRAALDELLDAVRELREREFQGADDTGTITSRVTGAGSVVAVYISPHALRDLAVDQLSEQCVQAVTAARRASADAWQELAAAGSTEDMMDLPEEVLGDPTAALAYWQRRTRGLT